MAGFLVAAIGWFAVLYPNISALPLPSPMVNAYQGILPTYLYAFQFPVSTVDRNMRDPDPDPDAALLTIVLTVTCRGGRLLGVGLARLAEAAESRPGRQDGAPADDRRPRPERRRLRDRRPEIGRQTSRSRRAGG